MRPFANLNEDRVPPERACSGGRGKFRRNPARAPRHPYRTWVRSPANAPGQTPARGYDPLSNLPGRVRAAKRRRTRAPALSRVDPGRPCELDRGQPLLCRPRLSVGCRARQQRSRTRGTRPASGPAPAESEVGRGARGHDHAGVSVPAWSASGVRHVGPNLRPEAVDHPEGPQGPRAEWAAPTCRQDFEHSLLGGR